MKPLKTIVIALSVILTVGTVVTRGAEELFTSIVGLYINEYKVSDSFELIDLGNIVLLPVTELGKLLDTQVKLNPQALTAELTRAWDGSTATLDLNSATAIIGDQSIAISPSPVADFGDFYIPSDLAADLFDVEINWYVTTQNLAVIANRELSMFEEKPAAETDKKEVDGTVIKQTPEDITPLISFGSIQYSLEHSFTSDPTRWAEVDELNLDAHLQISGCPIDIAGHSEEFLTDEHRWYLDQITATYRSDKMEIVLGDTQFSLGKILNYTPIRGIRYTAPPDWTSRILRASTTIEGYAPEGSTVELTVNGYYFGQVTPVNGHYLFESIPLQIIQVNTVVITVTESDGTKYSETRTIAATPKLLPAGKVESVVGGGVIRDEQTDDWTGTIAGAGIRTGVNSVLTVGAEVARKTPISGSDAPNLLAGDVNLAFRVSDSILFALDWLASKPEDSVAPLSQGAEIVATLQRKSYSIQSVIFYREPDLTLFSGERPDQKGYQVIAEYKLSNQFGVEVHYSTSEPVSREADPHQIVGAVFRFRPSTNQSVVFKLEREIERSDEIGLDYRWVSPRTEINLNTEWKHLLNDWRDPQSVQSRETIIHALNRSTYASLSRHDQVDWVQDKAIYHKSESEAQLSYYPGIYRFVGSAEFQTARNLTYSAQKELNAIYSLDASRPFGSVVLGGIIGLKNAYFADSLTDSVRSETIYLRTGSKYKDFYSELSLTHSEPLRRIKYKEAWTADLCTSYTLKNGMTLLADATAERELNEETEYRISLTLSQAIGFSNGGVRGFKATSGRPLGYIEGVVYIDQNRNGIRDKNEETISDIPVSLEGRRTFTDENGYYCFNYVSPGIYRLGFDFNQLPADYTPQTDSKLIKLSPNVNYTYDMAVSLNGTIEGSVFYDYNCNGELDADEEGLDWIKVVLDDGVSETFTDRRGTFILQNVNLGEHLVAVELESIPEWLTPPQPVTIEITRENLDVWSLLIPLQPRQTE